MAVRDELLTIGLQLSVLLRTPAGAGADIGDTLAAYSGLVDDLIAADATAVAIPGTAVLSRQRVDRATVNFFALDTIMANAILGAVVAVTSHEFRAKPEAIAAADTIASLWDKYVAWRDGKLVELNLIDAGASYQSVLKAVSEVTAFLVEISFTLQQEHRMVLDADRSAIDLCAEVYGAVDSMLDFFIASNELTGSEILSIPKGRQIVYYV